MKHREGGVEMTTEEIMSKEAQPNRQMDYDVGAIIGYKYDPGKSLWVAPDGRTMRSLPTFSRSPGYAAEVLDWVRNSAAVGTMERDILIGIMISLLPPAGHTFGNWFFWDADQPKVICQVALLLAARMEEEEK